MRFTMFENGGNLAHFLNEDSFFLPPDFDKDPQNDWGLIGPSGRTGGYVEGCCDTAGFLRIAEVGTGGIPRVDHGADTNYWEGNFHWNDLISSQFLGADTGVPNVRFKYEVTADKVGHPLNFTIGYREGGLAVDLFLFSTHPNLIDVYTQGQLDQLLVNKITVQDAGNKVGTGANAWSYLILEGESYSSKQNTDPAVGFTKVYAGDTNVDFHGTPILSKNTSASKEGALFTQTAFSQWADKVTYQVQFATPGTYYLYMRFTMFENGGNVAHYLNEDSYFLPPDFNKDPQNDWELIGPSGRTGGYVEGCCDTAGFLRIPDVGTGGIPRVDHGADTNNFWEGNFHWNDLISSQFLAADTGVPNVRFKYEVTADKVGHPLNFTIGYREGGLAIDLFLFSTHTNLMDVYTQAQLDQLLVKPAPDVTAQAPGDKVGTDANAWSYLIVEGESYSSKVNPDPAAGFAKVYGGDTNVDFYGTSILAADTTASKQGALFTKTAFSQWADKATYRVQFATPGTYYLYMRFTMFENGGNVAHYLNEDSYFLPPDFDKDPQNDWGLIGPSGRTGGYVEGCCDTAGFLRIAEVGTGGIPRVDHGADTNYWEGNFHWNDLISSQFLAADTGVPNVRFKYEVTADKVGHPLDFTIGYREGGLAIDLFLFSTHTNLIDVYTQAQLDQLLLKSASDVTVQDPGNIVGTGATAWSYLVMEGESYASKENENLAAGFAKVYGGGTNVDFYGTPILAADTTASKQGALFTQTAFAQWVDKVTYKVQFSTTGMYHLYMRFTMFENGGNVAHYLNEDSYFLPPDFNKDPQNDWELIGPSGRTGGYVEGCCDTAGFLRIPEVGTGGIPRVDHGSDTNFWGGNFHWNDLISSQFLAADTGVPNVRFKYEVTADKVGHPLNFTIGYREGGVTIDLFLFSTHTNLLDVYTQVDLDRLILGTSTVQPQLTIALSGTSAVVSWPTSATGYVLESASNLSTPGWTAVTTPPVVVVGDKNTVTVTGATGTQYYRLKKQ